MKKKFTICVLLFLINSIQAQSKIPCSSDRFAKNIFAEINKTTAEYATAKSWKGVNFPLLVDIYEPKKDIEKLRPLIIFAHGGSFIMGNKEQVAPFCTRFAKNGYVTASIQYRLIPPDKIREPNAILRELIRATNDMKAAIRFFRQSAKNGNPYKIDPNSIFIGGVSAGAITALHVGLLDESDEINPTLSKIIAEEGGFTGDTGSTENRKYSSKVRGIFNLSGAILNLTWINKNDAPIFSYHGTEDSTVSIGYRKIGEFELFGSESIQQKAIAVGLENLLVKVPKGGHIDIYMPPNLSFFEEFQNQANQKIRGMICE